MTKALQVILKVKASATAETIPLAYSVARAVHKFQKKVLVLKGTSFHKQKKEIEVVIKKKLS